MTAHLIRIQEQRFQRFPNIVARLALFEAEIRDMRADMNAAIADPTTVMTPFGLSDVAAEAAELTFRWGAHEPDDPIIYAGDEDDVPVPAGEE